MSNRLTALPLAIALFSSLLVSADEMNSDFPSVFVGTQGIWNNGSVQVVMADSRRKAILLTVRGVSDSRNEASLIINQAGKRIFDRNVEGLIILKGLKQILVDPTTDEWKRPKITMLIGFIEMNKDYDGIDARKLLENQPGEQVFREINSLGTKP